MIYPELIINSKNWKYVCRTIKNNRLPHALLFHGPKGSGKEGHAIELAAILNCLEKQNTNACGNCTSCIKTKLFKHEYVKLILPLPRGKISSSHDSTLKAFRSEKALQDYLNLLKEKSIDPYYNIRIPGSSTILINSIRELKHDISMSRANNAWQVVLIFEAEKLCVPSPTSANALLKILEEPPPRSVIILISSYPDILLDTIHSRCQSLFFPPIKKEVIENRLVQSGMDPIKASLVAYISNGNIRLSRDLKDNYQDIMDNLSMFLKACFSNNPNDWEKCIEVISRLNNTDENKLEQIFHFVKLFFRDIYYYSNTFSDDNIIFKHQINKIEKIIQLYSEADWGASIKHIEDTQNYISRKGYLPLMVTNLIIDIQKALKGQYHKPFQLSDWMAI